MAKRKEQKTLDELPAPKGVRPPFSKDQYPVHNAQEAKAVTGESILAFTNREKKKHKKTPDTKRFMSVSQAKGNIDVPNANDNRDVFFDGYDKLGLEAEEAIRGPMAYYYHLQQRNRIDTASVAEIDEILKENFPDSGSKKRSEMAQAIFKGRSVLDGGKPGSIQKFFDIIHRTPSGFQIPLIGERIAPDSNNLRNNLLEWEKVIARIVNSSKKLFFEYQIACFRGNIVLSNHPIDIVSKDHDGEIRVIEIKSQKHPDKPNTRQLLERLIINRAAGHIWPDLQTHSQRFSLSTHGRFGGIAELWYLGSSPLEYARIARLSFEQEQEVYNSLDSIQNRPTAKEWK